MLAALATLLALQGVDLSRPYKATLDWEEKAPAHRWTCGPDDVWSLSAFKFDAGKELALAFGFDHIVIDRERPKDPAKSL